MADAARAVLVRGADFDACVSEIRTQRGLPRDEAIAVVASAEGLALHLSDAMRSGYVGVRASTSGRRFEATASRNGAKVSLGSWPSAVQAAVAYARYRQARPTLTLALALALALSLTLTLTPTLTLAIA